MEATSTWYSLKSTGRYGMYGRYGILLEKQTAEV